MWSLTLRVYHRLVVLVKGLAEGRNWMKGKWKDGKKGRQEKENLTVGFLRRAVKRGGGGWVGGGA